MRQVFWGRVVVVILVLCGHLTDFLEREEARKIRSSIKWSTELAFWTEWS